MLKFQLVIDLFYRPLHFDVNYVFHSLEHQKGPLRPTKVPNLLK